MKFDEEDVTTLVVVGIAVVVVVEYLVVVVVEVEVVVEIIPPFDVPFGKRPPVKTQ